MVQQCVGQGLRGGKHIDFLGHGVAHHEAGRPALPFLEILDVATVDRGRDPARRSASIQIQRPGEFCLRNLGNPKEQG